MFDAGRTKLPPQDATLGGYLATHGRPPAFEGPDGFPYTVSVETEQTGHLLHPFSGFLVFPRWASTGAGIVGHLETRILCRGPSREAVEAELGSLTLAEVRGLLEEAIEKRTDETHP